VQRDSASPQLALGKHFLEENDGAGNTFKANANRAHRHRRDGATTLIFSIIGRCRRPKRTCWSPTRIRSTPVDPPAPFLLGLITAARIYWFTGASTQAVVTGAYRAVEFIKANIRLENAKKRPFRIPKRSSRSVPRTRNGGC
jgi:K(+)-stimulated pyrophosphate-energized sodium pump